MLVDVDEVLADFQTPAFEAIYQITGRRYVQEDFLVWNIFEGLSPEELKAVDAIIEAPGFCTALQPKPGACEAIEEIRSFADVYAVTSPQHNRHWVYERTEWLITHFGFTKKQVANIHDKFIVAGHAFLDDKPSHVEEWQMEYPGRLAMLWHIPNTRTLGEGLLRVHTWDEVSNLTKSLYDRLQ